ncbi:MAG: HAMP domain-containing sensor histidine kinase [Anaerolineae bacterium]
MRRSLTYKLIGAFLAVSVLAIVLVALASAVVASIEFNRLVSQEATSNFVAFVSDYYSAHGDLVGIDAALRERLQAATVAGESARLFPTGLTDPQGVVLLTAEGYRAGQQVPPEILASGTPIKVNGQVIAISLPRQLAPPRNRAQEQFMQTTAWALAIAAVGGALAAVLLGILLARTITRPVLELTDAARRMSKGNLAQTVNAGAADEVGELGRAFNQMSAELVRADQVRRQMTADIAHELRNPLTVIGGYIEAMRAGDLSATPARLNAVHYEVQHLEQIVDELRTLSLAEAGALTLNRQPLLPVDLLNHVAARYAQEAGQKGVTVSVHAPADLPTLSLDETRMLQVLGNLVSNALRFTPKGGEVELSARLSGNRMHFEVTDSGEGIPADELERVFDRFYRADLSRHGQEGHSGLGLAIAKAFVQAHGGKVWAESRPGQGATFVIEFPEPDDGVAR